MIPDSTAKSQKTDGDGKEIFATLGNARLGVHKERKQRSGEEIRRYVGEDRRENSPQLLLKEVQGILNIMFTLSNA